ncbi:AAA family ATPase [Patescibacteria group bacterium]|nr:AAA family ATPase [Patescibacteria group bacterium]MBU1500700.1 AAA family ATPase [Patescibacteria group bacterium]MBU2080982.1 AAA family ATPase [Patescibacteria group bacterium]MBU2124250.1 AAA family ATPase [Patescibacteria group bacterium]MBU2195043.1 AAA family ATPase [Patescibacteria group bacterium]
MIIGVTGTIGAGKGTLVDYLVEKRGFAHYSVRAFLVEEIEKRGMVPDRSAMRSVANELRAEHGPAYIIESLYTRAVEVGGDALIESIRAIGEAEFLKEKGAKILAVDADRKIRYDRICERGASTDHVDFDTWVMQEERELASVEPWDMNVLGVMAMADVRIENDGAIENFEAMIDGALDALQ